MHEPLEEQVFEAPACINQGNDLDTLLVGSVDESPRRFGHLTPLADAVALQFGDHPAAIGKCVKTLRPLFNAIGSGKGVLDAGQRDVADDSIQVVSGHFGPTHRKSLHFALSRLRSSRKTVAFETDLFRARSRSPCATSFSIASDRRMAS